MVCKTGDGLLRHYLLTLTALVMYTAGEIPVPREDVNNGGIRDLASGPGILPYIRVQRLQNKLHNIQTGGCYIEYTCSSDNNTLMDCKKQQQMFVYIM